MRLAKLAIASVSPTVGAVTSNASRLIAIAGEMADANVTIGAFPEQAIGGYPPEDLVQWPGFLDGQRRELERFAKETGGTATVYVIGLAVSAAGQIYNAAAVVHRGRIAGIVDCYDAITSDRPYAKALSQYEAIRKLYEWRDQDFQGDIVEQFIQCLGVYPTGSLVELTTGQVGIVLAQNPVRRLKPVLMLILDEDKVAYSFQPRLDLVNEDQTATGEPIDILRALEPGSYGIDPADYYI